MINNNIINQVTIFCTDNLPLIDAKLSEESYSYTSIPLCVTDSIFSIGVRYQSVKNTIERLCNYLGVAKTCEGKQSQLLKHEQLSVSDFLSRLEKKSIQDIVRQVFNNRQRTSSRNGILKVEAVLKFCKVLKEFGCEYFQDIHKLSNNKNFEEKIKEIPGQGSGLSLAYFFMLAGNEELIKADRMIISFLKTATAKEFSASECQLILTRVTHELNKIKYNLTPRLLDNIIWVYQRNANRNHKNTNPQKHEC